MEKILFFPEYAATSFWDDEGCNVCYEEFDLSENLIKELEEFDNSYWEFLEPISEERVQEIYKNGLRLYNLVVEELKDKYEVINRLDLMFLDVEE